MHRTKKESHQQQSCLGQSRLLGHIQAEHSTSLDCCYHMRSKAPSTGLGPWSCPWWPANNLKISKWHCRFNAVAIGKSHQRSLEIAKVLLCQARASSGTWLGKAIASCLVSKRWHNAFGLLSCTACYKHWNAPHRLQWRFLLCRILE